MMDDKQLYALAKAGDPACIPGLLSMISFSALEILRLEGERDSDSKIPSGIVANFMRSYRSLNPTERKILDYVVKAWGNAAIAAAMKTSEQVIKNRLNSIFGKMGVNSRAQLIVKELQRRYSSSL